MSHGRSDPCVQLKGEPELRSVGRLLSWIEEALRVATTPPTSTRQRMLGH